MLLTFDKKTDLAPEYYRYIDIIIITNIKTITDEKKLRHVEIKYSCGKTRSKLAIFSSVHRVVGGVKWVFLNLVVLVICLLKM